MKKKMETLLQAVRKYSQDIWMEFGIKMFHANNEKQERKNDERNRTTKSRKNKNTWKKENVQILANIGNQYHQASGDERKNFKKLFQSNEKTSRTQAEISSKR